MHIIQRRAAIRSEPSGRGRARRLPTLLSTLLVVGAPACTSLTDVKTTGTIDETTITGPLGAANRYSGALRLMSVAMIPTILASGGFTDELVYSGTFSASAWAIETRTVPEQSVLITSGDHFTAYSALHQARLDILHTVDALKRDAPTPGGRIARMYALAGFTEVLHAELFCSGVPVSDYKDTEISYGTPMTTAQLLGLAIQQFDSALAYAGDSVRFANLARVGKGRALLDLGRATDAAAAVAAVPTSFRYDVEYNAAVTGQTNTLFQANGTVGGSYTVADQQGGTGLDFRSAADPRIRTTSGALGTDGTTRIFALASLTSLSTPLTLATGVEARLIEAEAALEGGNLANWLAKLNDPRANAISPALPALTDPGTAGTRVDLTFRERAFWMYLTAHRLGDARRLIRKYGRSAASVFPSQGTYKDGTAWGSDVTLPVPDLERYNPLFNGCIDRNA